jgi:hypothetical protein
LSIQASTRRTVLQWFTVTPESTVDLNPRPDLRIEIPAVGAVPEEVKMANLSHWSADKLLERLEVQLVGQYLRASDINYGVYVIGNTDPGRWWKRPGDVAVIDFAGLISLLEARARELIAQHSESVHGLSVVGIDFTDPRDQRAWMH